MTFLTNDNKYLSISHGINLQVLAYIMAIGVYIKYDKKHIIILMFILFISNSLSDISTFYNDENLEDKNSIINNALIVFVTEFIIITILVLPLIFVSNKFFSLLISYSLSFILLYTNNSYNLHYSNEKNIGIIIFFYSISYLIYLLTLYTDKYL
jgi:hypothetical protein